MKIVQNIIISIELKIVKLISVNSVKHNNYQKDVFLFESVHIGSITTTLVIFS